MPVKSIKEEEIVSVPEKKSSGGKAIFVLLILLILATAGFVWSYSNYRSIKKQASVLSTPEGQQQLAQQEIDVIVAKVGRLIVLPNETPILATIQNAEELAKTQPFYVGSTNGDRVLIYQQAAKAIIYNEAKDILINVGPVFMDKNQTAPTDSTPPEAQKISVEFRNGTETAGLARTRSEEIDANVYQVSSIAEAKDKNYQENIIVNLTGADVSALENKFGVKAVTSLPEGEAVSSADVVIIVGK